MEITPAELTHILAYMNVSAKEEEKAYSDSRKSSKSNRATRTNRRNSPVKSRE